MHQNHKRTYHLLALKFGKKKQASPCCRCSLLSPYLCSLPLWRAALRSSRSPPPGSGSLHQRCSQRFNTRNRRKLHSAFNPDLAHHTTHRTTPAPASSPPALRRMCNFHSAGLPPQCLVKLQFRDRLCIDTRIVQQLIIPGFYRSVHLGRRRVHSYVHCVAAGLRFCSPNLHLFLHHLAGSSHRQRILMIGDCMVQLPHKLGIVGAGCDMEECRPILRSRPHAAPPQG